MMRSFHPSAMPALSRAHYRRELWIWSLLPVALGAVEGGVTGVIAKNAFEHVTDPARLNLAVAILSGAPAFANIMSFLWSAISHGRNKIRLLTTIQMLTIGFVLLIAFAPLASSGLIIMIIGAVGARVCWTGVIMLRTTVWRGNYARSSRATLTGKLATLQALVMAGTSLAIGFLVGLDPDAFRIAYPIAALAGLIGVLIGRRMRMRGHAALLASERRESHLARAQINPLSMLQVLRKDDHYRRYMTIMFVFGSGNLMAGAMLVIVLKDYFQLSEINQVLIAATIPLLLMPVSIPIWSRLLDRMHIIAFRAVHSWAFVTAISLILLAWLIDQPWLLLLAAIMKGIAYGGGVLGWNLGHHDFASTERQAQYMGVHVSLTGVRGVLAPLLGVTVYQLLEYAEPGMGPLVFALCLLLSVAGAIGFVHMARRTPPHQPEIAPPPSR